MPGIFNFFSSSLPIYQIWRTCQLPCPSFFFVPVFSGNYYRKKPHLLILTLDSLAFLRRKRCLFFPGSISITPWQWPELWIFKYFLRLSSVDLQVQPLPPSLCQHLEYSSTIDVPAVCAGAGVLLSPASSTGDVPGLSWALWALSLPFPRVGSHVLLEESPKCQNAVPPWHPSLSAAVLY